MEPTLKLTIQKADPEKNIQIFKFEGDFDKAGYAEIQDKFDQALDNFGANADGAKNLVFDFSGLKYINSQGIGILMDLSGKLKDKKKKLVIVGSAENVQDVFKAIGLNEVVETHSTLDSFLNS